MSQLTCRELSLGYEGKEIISNLSFHVNAGDYLCIVGENGSGKSTLMKTILGLRKPMKGEIITGDMPTPVKYFNPEIRNAYKAVEKVAENKLIEMLPDDLRGLYRPLISDVDPALIPYVKAADKLSALIKCIEEVRMGNNEFLKAKAATEEAIDAMDLPALKIFKDEYLPAYYLTLDELG